MRAHGNQRREKDNHSYISLRARKTNDMSKSPYINYTDSQLLKEYKKHYHTIGFETASKENIEIHARRVKELEGLVDTLYKMVLDDEEQMEKAGITQNKRLVIKENPFALGVFVVCVCVCVGSVSCVLSHVVGMIESFYMLEKCVDGACEYSEL
jgi:hypothetical protein